MDTNLINVFNVLTKKPIDKRFTVDLLSDIVTPYEGLFAYQKSDQLFYKYTNGVWTEFLHDINNQFALKINTNDYVRAEGSVADTGVAGAYVITLSPPPTAYIPYQVFNFKALNSNTGASTLNVNSLGVKSIKKDVNVDLVTGDILAGQIITCLYDGTNFQIIPNYSTQLSTKINTNDYVRAEGSVVDTGIANAYVMTLSPAPISYIQYQVFNFKALNGNTGASTLNVNGLGNKSIKKDVNVDLVAGDILSGQIITCLYDGTNFQIIPNFATQLGSKANVTQPSIIAPTLLNGWVNVGSGNANAGYFKDTLGFVHGLGGISGGTVTNGTILFNLPVGFRPSSKHSFVVGSNSAGYTSTLLVDSSGNVTIMANGYISYMSLDGISFKAEQ